MRMSCVQQNGTSDREHRWQADTWAPQFSKPFGDIHILTPFARIWWNLSAGSAGPVKAKSMSFPAMNGCSPRPRKFRCIKTNGKHEDYSNSEFYVWSWGSVLSTGEAWGCVTYSATNTQRWPRQIGWSLRKEWAPCEHSVAAIPSQPAVSSQLNLN